MYLMTIDTYLEETNETELFFVYWINMLYLHGAWGLILHKVDELLFSKRTVPNLEATMSKNLFFF